MATDIPRIHKWWQQPSPNNDYIMSNFMPFVPSDLSANAQPPENAVNEQTDRWTDRQTNNNIHKHPWMLSVSHLDTSACQIVGHFFQALCIMVPTISWQWNSRTFPGLFQDISEFSWTLTDLMIDKKVNTQHKTIYETGQHIAKPGNYYLKPNKYNHSLINVAYQIWSMTMIKSQLIQRSVICNNSMG